MIEQSGASVGEFIDLVTVKSHLRVDHDDENAIIALHLLGAVKYLEMVCNTVFLTADFVSTTDTFSVCFKGYPNPVVSSVSYVDELGAVIAVTDFEIKNNSLFLPTVPSDLGGSVTVNFTAGMGAGNIPASITLACLLLVAAAYEERGENVDYPTYALSFGFRQLIAPHRSFGYAV